VPVGITEEVEQALASSRLLMVLRKRIRFVTTGLLGDFSLLERSYKRIVELEKEVVELKLTSAASPK
jgi:hypothetical protein